MHGFARTSAIIAAAALAALTTGAAYAADIKVKAPLYKAPPPVVVYDWTGCYAGGNAGWIGGGDQFDLTPSGAFDRPINVFSIAANRAPLLSSYRPHTSGITGGFQIGCNRQFGGFVVGVEADLNFSSLDENIVASYPGSPVIGQSNGANPRTERVRKELDWFSTYRGRVGYAADRLLIYGTGGLAVAHIKTSTDVFFDPNTPGVLGGFHFASSTSLTRWGYAVGAGAEYGFGNNWTVKAEYLYLGFGSFSHVLPEVTAPAFTWTNNMRFREHVARVGFNYRFGPSAVVARY
jgi:outer membrane immunogenic protein